MHLAEITLSENAFLAIKVGYIVAGLVCLALAATGFGQTTGTRIINGLLGLAMFGYAVYLFVADPASVRVFWYALLLPVILLFQAFSNRSKAAKQEA